MKKKMNKKIIITTCCILITSVVTTGVTGILCSQKINKVGISKKPVSPWSIKIQDDGHIVVQDVINNDNKNYEYKIDQYAPLKEPIKIDSPVAINLKKSLKDSFVSDISKRLTGDLNQKIEVNSQFLNAMGDIIPNNSFSLNENITFNQFMDIALNDSMNFVESALPNTNDLRRILAVNGINLDESYNDFMLNGVIPHNNDTQNEYNPDLKPTLYGGGGHFIPSVSVPQVEPVDVKTATFQSLHDSLDMDKQIRYSFWLQYTAIVYTLTAIQVAISFFTFGIGAVGLALDLFFATWESISAYNEFCMADDTFSIVDTCNRTIYKLNITGAKSILEKIPDYADFIKQFEPSFTKFNKTLDFNFKKFNIIVTIIGIIIKSALKQEMNNMLAYQGAFNE